MDNESLNKLADYLLAKQLMLATAESCTGGMVASLITDIPGSSRWFERGFITYSNSAKQQCLQVDAAIIEKFGAVSEPVVKLMALGTLKNSQADVTIATTGIAGPDGGTADKPVGTVCFAWVFSEQLIAQTKYFKGNRYEIRQQASCYAINQLLEFLTFR